MSKIFPFAAGNFTLPPKYKKQLSGKEGGFIFG